MVGGVALILLTTKVVLVFFLEEEYRYCPLHIKYQKTLPRIFSSAARWNQHSDLILLGVH